MRPSGPSAINRSSMNKLPKGEPAPGEPIRWVKKPVDPVMLPPNAPSISVRDFDRIFFGVVHSDSDEESQ